MRTTELTEGRRAFVPLGGSGTAEDIGRVVVFLGSDAARYVNGVNLPVDGGASQALISLIPTIGPGGEHLASPLAALLRGTSGCTVARRSRCVHCRSLPPMLYDVAPVICCSGLCRAPPALDLPEAR